MSELVGRILNGMGLLGVTPAMLTEYVPLAENTVEQWEQGLGQEPSDDELVRIADCFNVPLGYLLADGNAVSESSPPWKFKPWLTRFRDVNLPIGDLSKEVLSDIDFPEDAGYLEMLNYIAHKSGYNQDVIETFRTVWNFYFLTR